MASDLEATIVAGGRRLKLVGTRPAYMRALQEWPADKSAVAQAIKAVPHGSLCFDVGAHIGLTAITMAAMRPDCRIVAFEPLPRAHSLLRQNVVANGINNIELIEAAVSDFSGTISFVDNGPGSVANFPDAKQLYEAYNEAISFENPVWSGGDAPVFCKSLRLDDLDLGSPALIKIDVEGFEPNVLAGARQMITKTRPLILVEFNSWTLMLHHYDPISYASALWSNFDILQMFHGEFPLQPPTNPRAFVLMNLLRHGCVTDLLVRPRAIAPDVYALTDTPQAAQLRLAKAEFDALHRSTAGRAKAALRSIMHALIRPPRQI